MSAHNEIQEAENETFWELDSGSTNPYELNAGDEMKQTPERSSTRVSPDWTSAELKGENEAGIARQW
jgi:hypothetical protein